MCGPLGRVWPRGFGVFAGVVAKQVGLFQVGVKRLGLLQQELFLFRGPDDLNIRRLDCSNVNGLG